MTPTEGKLKIWIESHLGGDVLSCEPEDRWREFWRVELRHDGRQLPIYVRGDRNEEFAGNQRIPLEAAVLRTLGEAGYPVPRIYGVCPDPHAILMEVVGGRHNLETAESEAERVSVLDELGHLTARLHAFDIQPFVAAGIPMPQTPREIMIPSFNRAEKFYRARKSRPDPRAEFFCRWVARNMPPVPPRLSLLHGDPGQFLFADGRITAMIDFELACIGDPLQDLAGLRVRALTEPMGDLRPAFRRYKADSGVALDARVISFHTAQWTAASMVLMANVLSDPKPTANYMEYLSWYIGCLMNALDGVAEAEGFSLSPDEEQAPLARPSRWGPSFGCLADKFTPGENRLQGYERSMGEMTTRFLRQVDALGDWAEAGYLRDCAALLGTTPDHWREADEMVEAFVLQAGPEHDAQIATLFYRWAKRQLRLVEGLYSASQGQKRIQPLAELLNA